MLGPIAMKGLNFITNRARSAPPTPGDRIPLSLGSTSPPKVPSPAAFTELSSLTPPLENGPGGETYGQQIALDGVLDSLPTMRASLEGYDVGGKENANAGNNDTKSKILPATANVGPFSALSSAAASRSVSPTPSLEAVLLDRKRRLAAGGGQTSPTLPLPSQKSSSAAVPEQQRPATAPRAGSNIKGKFKSSPLGGGERSGVVVAEKVKEDLRNLGIGEVPLPDEIGKAGPDKKQYSSEGA